MNLPSASTQPPVNAQLSGEVDTHLHGRWLLLYLLGAGDKFPWKDMASIVLTVHAFTD